LSYQYDYLVKNFDLWNVTKKNIDSLGQYKFYHPRDIWWCTFGLNIGFEQDGTGHEYERPVLILRGFNKQICLIIPLTTSKKKNKYLIPVGLINGKNAQAIISQIRLIDTKRLSNKIGIIDKERFSEIKKAVKDLI